MEVNVDIDFGTLNTNPIQGHVYRHENGPLYLCAYRNQLVSLETGDNWAGERGFVSPEKFTDVTNLVQVTNI